MNNDLETPENKLVKAAEPIVLNNDTDDKDTPIICKNCGHMCDDSFCPVCGQKTSVKRLTFKILISNIIESWFNADRGIFRTIKELFSNPSSLIVDYISGKRIRYFAPFPLMFITATFYALVENINSTEVSKEIIHAEGITNFNAINYIYNIIEGNQAISALIAIPLYVVCVRLAFGKKFRHAYNWTECFYATAYYNAQIFIISIFTQLASILFPSAEDIIDISLFGIMIVFIAWDMSKMSDLPFKKNLLKGFWTTILVLLGIIIVFAIVITIIVIIRYIFQQDIGGFTLKFN